MLNAFIREVGVLTWARRTLVRQVHKRVLRRQHAVRLPTGGSLSLPVSSAFATEVFVTGADVDWGSEALLAEFLKRIGEGCFLDVGANIGYYSVYFAPLVPAVYAFEPDPLPRAVLQQNCTGHANVAVIPYAVGSHSGIVRFARAHASELSHIAEVGEDGVDTPLVSIDDFVAERGIKVAAIKTDIEGFDLAALRGASRVLHDQRPIVLSELQPDAEVTRFAAEIGYRVFACAREKRSRERRFVAIDGLPPTSLVFKMLFLVPAERASQLGAMAAAIELRDNLA